MAVQTFAVAAPDRAPETKEAVDRAVAATEGVRDLIRECNGSAATFMRKALTDGIKNGRPQD